ncbi:MAG: hypothetical protein GY948_05605 [Alphaproteobacteria bacterium]|nr:hypothetical protein [Alphaproteobacteria bacterium]
MSQKSSLMQSYKCVPQALMSDRRDEASIARWRTDTEHHNSQAAGRYKHFEDYRIRISHVLQYSEPGLPQKEWGKEGSYSDPATTPDRFITIIRTKQMPTTTAGEVFESVTETGSYLSVGDVACEDDGRVGVKDAQTDALLLSALLSRVSRDYGMYDRAEAPQYFKPVEQQD